MEAAKQALIDEIIAAEEAIRKAILAACAKIQEKIPAAFEPGVERKAVADWVMRAPTQGEEVLLMLRKARACVDEHAAEVVVRVPFEITTKPGRSGLPLAVSMRVPRDVAPT